MKENSVKECVFLAFFLSILALINGQQILFTAPSQLFPRGENNSRWYEIRLSQNPGQPIRVSPSQASANNFNFFPPYVDFEPTETIKKYSIVTRTNQVGPSFNLQFQADNVFPNSAVTQVQTTNFGTIRVSPSSDQTLFVGGTQNFTITLPRVPQNLPSSAVTVSSGNGGIVQVNGAGFADLLISSPSASTTFQVACIAPTTSPLALTFSVQPFETEVYWSINPGSIDIECVESELSLLATTSTLVGESAKFIGVFDPPAPKTVQVRSQAQPSNFNGIFNETTGTFPFSITPQVPASFQVYWDVDGDDEETLTLTASKRSFVVAPQVPSDIPIGSAIRFSISVTEQPINFVEVSLFGVNMEITPSSVNFTSSITSQSFEVVLLSPGTHTIFFSVTGEDAPFYNSISSIPINAVEWEFVVDEVDDLYVGNPSPPVIVSLDRISPRPISLGVYTSLGAIIEPPVLTLSEENGFITNFTITCTEAGSDTVVFLLSGENADWFSVPSSIPFNCERRSVQVFPLSTTQNTPVYLGSPFTITISTTSVAPVNSLIATPSCPGASFSPSSVTLTKEKPSATVSMVASTPISSTIVSVALGGPEGGWYTSPSFLVSLQRSSITFERVPVQSFDDRNPLGGNTLNDADYAPTVFKFTLDAPPSTQLVIVPRATNLIFIPEQITFGPGEIEKEFSILGPVAGSHPCWFELTGEEALNYLQPSTQTFLSQKTVEQTLIIVESSSFTFIPMWYLILFFLFVQLL